MRGIKPTGVYGLPRGGLIFATWLSYKLDIPLLMHAADGCIIIDDISDTGRSLYHFTENRSQFNKYFCIFTFIPKKFISYFITTIIFQSITNYFTKKDTSTNKGNKNH